jgi:hypothetical protein
MFQRDLGKATALVDTAQAALMQVAAIRTHVSMQFERTWENVGQMRLGLPPRSFF